MGRISVLRAGHLRTSDLDVVDKLYNTGDSAAAILAQLLLVKTADEPTERHDAVFRADGEVSKAGDVPAG